jgi:hypothetical protein
MIHKQQARVPRKTLLIGFAYSLTPDGAPGSYNRALAASIKKDIDGGIDNAWIGKQWEIYDALEELCAERGETVPVDVVPLSLVATPPPFSSSEIRHPNEFIAFIKRNEAGPVTVFRHKLLNVITSVGHTDVQNIRAPNNEILKEVLAAYLNSMLHDPFFYQSFAKDVELKPLVRQAKDREWREERVMPTRHEYPNGLRRFQRQRVNRLIIEAIIPEDILKRGGYLSTRGVLDQIVPEIGRAGRDITTVRVYGHPAHRPRCRRQFLEYVWNEGWPLSSDQVTFGHMYEFWDSGTAQQWCRSRDEWDQYEKDPGRLK